MHHKRLEESDGQSTTAYLACVALNLSPLPELVHPYYGVYHQESGSIARVLFHKQEPQPMLLLPGPRPDALRGLNLKPRPREASGW